VPDNTLLGLPLEGIYGEEIAALRRERRRLGEVISLAADKEVKSREFIVLFKYLIKAMFQYHVCHGGDSWVITVNPRHRDFYSKAMGFVPLGPPRTYSAVQDHPAEGYWVDAERMEAAGPKMHREIFGEWLPGEALTALRMPPHLISYLGGHSSKTSAETLPEVFDLDRYFSRPRRW
jgi:hypothetical protein